MTQPPRPAFTVEPGLHLLTVSGSDEARRTTWSAWAVDGFAEGLQLVYAESDRGHEETASVSDALAGRGVDVEGARRSGQMVRLSMTDLYDIDLPGRLLARAQADGFGAVRVGTQARHGLEVLDRWSYLTYERRLSLACADSRVSVLCQYEPAMAGIWFAEASGVHDGGGQGTHVIVVPRRGEVALTGEVDVSNADWVTAGLRAATRTCDHELFVDLSGLRVIGAAGSRALLAGTEAFRARGGQVVLANARPVVRRVLLLLGVDQVPGFILPAERN